MKFLSVLSLCVLLSVVGAEVLDSFSTGGIASSTYRYFAFSFIQGQTTKGYQQLDAYMIQTATNSPFAYGKAYLFSSVYPGTPANLASTSPIAVATANAQQTVWTFTGSFTLTQGTRYYIYLDTTNGATSVTKRATSDPTRPTYAANSANVGFGNTPINNNEFYFVVLGSSCGNNAVENGETCDGSDCCTAVCTAAPSSQRCTGDDRCKFCSGTTGLCGSSPVPSTQRCGMCATGGITAYCSGSAADPRCGISCTAGVINDPLIMGFHHQQFYFDGVVNSVFNMLSQPHLSINGLFKAANGNHSHLNTIVIGEAGIVTQNNKISFSVDAGRKGVITWNGETLRLNSSVNIADLDDCVQLTWSETSIMLSSPTFEVVVAFKNQLPSEKIFVDYLNIKLVHIVGKESQMGGVIGQTAMKNAPISIKPSDFQVSNIVATDSIKSTYTAAAIDCDHKRDHSVRFSASLEHGLDEQRAYENYDA